MVVLLRNWKPVVSFYLEQSPEDDKFIPRIPLILIVILVEYFNLQISFDEVLLNPFFLINQDNFPEFILHTINTIEYHEQPPLIPKNDSKEFIRPELNRRCVEVICSKDTDIRGYQEIDATTGRYIIKIRRRCHSADAILSHADEQYKYSEALESGYLVHEDGLGEIDANDVKKEEVKTHATGAERLVIVTPKRFEEGDEQLIPRNCAIVSGNDFQ
ncbi:16096_t:CDS:2 [Entrophospora sp. SA101]|nr:16096_t:CDS:2 [Entrophospora sp. SA101]